MSDFVNTRTTLGDQATLDALIAHSLTELNDNLVTELGLYALYKNAGIETISFPALTTAGHHALSYCPKLETVSLAEITTLPNYMFASSKKLKMISLPKVTNVGQYAFQNCMSLANVSFPLATTINSYAFDGCSCVTSVSIPVATSVGQYAFKNVPVGTLALPAITSLQTYVTFENGAGTVDITNKVTIIENTFNGDYNLFHLILRSNKVCPLSATSAFTNTPIAAGKGFIYVPADLVATYKSSSNWSTYSSQIVAISAYPKTIAGTITDSWSDIFDAEDDGTYSTKYSIGDTKYVNVNGVPICMEIVAFDGDALATGNGNAKITWLCKGCQGSLQMNPTATSSGGWASSAMRQYLIDFVLENIQSDVKEKIKPVYKTYFDVSDNSTKVSTDSIWIPSYREMGYGTNKENSGVIYSGKFTDKTSRIKYMGSLSGSAGYWWLRSAYSGDGYFDIVNGSGGTNGINASSAGGVVFGFCT